jgi:hypothetical protein
MLTVIEDLILNFLLTSDHGHGTPRCSHWRIDLQQTAQNIPHGALFWLRNFISQNNNL